MGRSLRPNRGVASNKAAIRAATSSAEPVDVELAPLSALPIKLVESLGGGAGVRRPTAPAERRVVVAASTPPTTDHVDGRACEKRANVIVLATAPVGCRVRKTLIPATPPGAEPAVNLDRTLSFGVAAEDAADLAVDAVAAVGAAAPLRLGVVADVGCGAGYFAKRLRSVMSGNVIALDKSPVAIEKAKRLNSDQGIDYHLGDAVLPWPVHERLDAVFLIGVIEHITEGEAVLKNAYDSLKPGGDCLFVRQASCRSSI